MCGICASIGFKNGVELVVDGLRKLEYRGYDSSGIAYLENGEIKLVKSVGQIKNLQAKISSNLQSDVVIGHTRWATHGKVSVENAHPHVSYSKSFALVHNGIVENYEKLKKQFQIDNLYSQTDTEVLVNLIEKQEGKILDKLISACNMVEGSFAVCLIERKSEKIYLAKRNSPLMVAVNENGCMAGSDISIFAKKFEECYILEDDEFVVANAKKLEFFNKNGEKIEKSALNISNFDFADENLNEKYFMLKEIKEQPIVLKKTFFKYFSENYLNEHLLNELGKFKQFHFIACGTAYHSSLMGALYLEKFCRKQCQVSIASEFRYANRVLSKNCLYVFVSQSGETADTIACAKLVKEKGMQVMCVTNVPYSTLEHIADYVLPTFAGKEVAVASTKAYVSQVFTLLILVLKLAKIDEQDLLKDFVLRYDYLNFDDNLLLPISKFKKVFFIGRGQDYVTSLEASLKLKEIAYLNCMGMASGELKHGTLALIDKDTLVIAISTVENLKSKVESNIEEVKARGGKVFLISNLVHNVEVDFRIDLPSFDEILMPIVSVIPLQLLAFNYALMLGFNPDKPRNLAKSVTVE